MMRLLIIMSAMWSAIPSAANAWGKEGHRVIAQIAEARLTPTAREEVHRLLAIEGVAHMGDVASWADEIKHDRANHPAHTIRLPLNGADVKLDSCPSRFCVVSAVEHFSAILADRKASPNDRLEALKYVIHFVGDAHQPLHTAQVTGSKIRVLFNGDETTLHKVWDTGILQSQGGDPDTLAQRLIVGGWVKPAAGGRPIDWAIEGRDIARDHIFNCIPTRTKDVVTLDPDYAAENWPIVRARLAAAGERLAEVLNKAL